MSFENSSRPEETKLSERNPSEANGAGGTLRPLMLHGIPTLRSELLSFPAGKHDDQVDALGLVGQLLDKMLVGEKPETARVPANPSGYKTYETETRDNDWISY
jgi:hypothetical protein